MSVLSLNPDYSEYTLEDLNPDLLKRNYFFGVDFIDIAGNEMDMSVVKWHIDSAVNWLESELEIDIVPRTREDRVMYNRLDFTSWGNIQVSRRPIKEVLNLNLSLVNNTSYDIPVQWVRFNKERGTLWIVPSAVGNVPFLAGGNLMLPYLLGQQWFPQAWTVKYTTGFDKLPTLMVDVIMKKAAIEIYQVLGSNVLGPGIASMSLGMDGLSQSIGTSQSAMYHMYSAQIEVYRRDIWGAGGPGGGHRGELQVLKEYWRGVEVVMLT